MRDKGLDTHLSLAEATSRQGRTRINPHNAPKTCGSQAPLQVLFPQDGQCVIRDNGPLPLITGPPGVGTVRRLAPAGDITLGRAADAYLATLRGAERENTRRVYGRVLHRMIAEFGSGTAPDEIGAELLTTWFGEQWGKRAPSTWNVSLDAVRSAVAYWQRQGWLWATEQGGGQNLMFLDSISSRASEPGLTHGLALTGVPSAFRHPRRACALSFPGCWEC